MTSAPEDPEIAQRARLASAGELVAARKFDQAEGEILRALEGVPADAKALNLLALVRYKLGRLEEARATYREIAGASPQDAGARRNLGLLSLKLGRPDEALPELEMAVRMAPGDERAWSYLGYSYAKKGKVVEAAAAFRRAGQDALAAELEQSAKSHVPRSPAPLGRVAFARPVALAPPLPAPAGEGGEARREPRVEASAHAMPAAIAETLGPPQPREVEPIPLLSFVLSRLGQSPAPPTPAGALRLTISDEAHARADAILAGAGALKWEPGFRRAQGRPSTELLGDEKRPYFRLTGAGEVWIAGAPGRWLPLRLADDVLYVREDRVLAFEGSLTWEAGTVPNAGLRMLQFRGRGTVALDLHDASIALKVTDDKPTLLAGARLIGWVGRLVPHGERLPGASPFQLACQGEGVVLLDAAVG
jgi:tetratricopeptide (TPR) repeat protein